LWDYVSGTCKKTYQGHINKKYSLGGTFGIAHGDPFIVSGSEDGDILFWDVRSKDLVQRVSGHQGPVCWVDTYSGSDGSKVVSGGLDGTVSIWINVDEDEDEDRTLGGMDALNIERQAEYDEPMDDIKREEVDGYNDTQREASEKPSPGVMDQD